MTRRMFGLWKDEERIKTVNPIHGCRFSCYSGNCWAARRSKRLQARGVKGYENGFEPRFCPRFLNRRYRRGDVVFVGSMGDISFFSKSIFLRILRELVEKSPDAMFFFETKNPAIYERVIDEVPDNVILSATIETNRNYRVSKAPSPEKRYMAMRDLDWDKKHISVEPIMDFDFKIFLNWFREMAPRGVSVGYDNYHSGLLEPPLPKTKKLIGKLDIFCDYVERKTLRERRHRKDYRRARSETIRRSSTG